MRSTFRKHFDFGMVDVFESYPFRERGRRGRSGRENTGKMTATVFLRRDFLTVWLHFGGQGHCAKDLGSSISKLKTRRLSHA